MVVKHGGEPLESQILVEAGLDIRTQPIRGRRRFQSTREVFETSAGQALCADQVCRSCIVPDRRTFQLWRRHFKNSDGALDITLDQPRNSQFDAHLG